MLLTDWDSMDGLSAARKRWRGQREEKRRPFNTAFTTQLYFRHCFCSSFLMISLQKCMLKMVEKLELEEEPYKII